MNKLIKRIFSAVIAGTLVIYTLPIYAVVNEENVYSKLNAKGENYKTIVTTKKEDKITKVESDKELPIETKITYFLNDNEILPEELVGKSGNVKIKIEYINKTEQMVTVNGIQEKMYTPFVVVSGAIINSKNNKNIKISNGKIIENGNNTIVLGIVMPGLEESLKLPSNIVTIDIPNNLEINVYS